MVRTECIHQSIIAFTRVKKQIHGLVLGERAIPSREFVQRVSPIFHLPSSLLSLRFWHFHEVPLLSFFLPRSLVPGPGVGSWFFFGSLVFADWLRSESLDDQTRRSSLSFLSFSPSSPTPFPPFPSLLLLLFFTTKPTISSTSSPPRGLLDPPTY